MSLRVAGGKVVAGSLSPLAAMAVEAIGGRMAGAGARGLSRGPSAARGSRAPLALAAGQLGVRGPRGPGRRPMSGGAGFERRMRENIGGSQVALSVSDRFDVHAELATAG